MSKRMRTTLISLATLLVTVALWDARLWTKHARAQGKTQAGRSQYYGNTYSEPFTVESRVTLVGESTTKVLHNDETVSVNSRGDLLRIIKKFDSPRATMPYGELHHLEPLGA